MSADFCKHDIEFPKCKRCYPVEKKLFAAMNALADKVLAYRPKPKSKPAKKRQRVRRKIQRESSI